MADLADFNVATLLQRYREAAAEHGRGTALGNHITANHAYKELSEVFAELRGRNGGTLVQLLSLLGDNDDWVNLWVACHALAFAPEKGEEVLTALATMEGLVGLDAGMTLEMWRNGELHFP